MYEWEQNVFTNKKVIAMIRVFVDNDNDDNANYTNVTAMTVPFK